ncbi:uncharacterized protein M6D78_007564 [Vipera latastei]
MLGAHPPAPPVRAAAAAPLPRPPSLPVPEPLASASPSPGAGKGRPPPGASPAPFSPRRRRRPLLSSARALLRRAERAAAPEGPLRLPQPSRGLRRAVGGGGGGGGHVGRAGAAPLERQPGVLPPPPRPGPGSVEGQEQK